MIKQITSIQNPLIKLCMQLQEKSRERRKSGLFVIEGEREIGLALKRNYEIETLIFSNDIFPKSKATRLVAEKKCVEVPLEIYQKLAYRESTEGVMAIAKAKQHALSNINFTTKNSLI